MSDWKKCFAGLRPHRREQAKLVLGLIFHRRATLKWLKYVCAQHTLWARMQSAPKLLTRIYRPYGYAPLNCRQRVDVLLNHYSTLEKKGLTGWFNASVFEPLRLSEIPTKSGHGALMELMSLREGHREGEMSLVLKWQDRVVFSLSFLLSSTEGHTDLIVTRLQGNRDADGREVIRQATKDFHGYRPAVLITQAARHLAHVCSCQRVLLVSNRQRVALNPFRRRQIKTDLDGLWMEMGAQAHSSGFFTLSPQVDLPDDFNNVVSSKRAQAKRKVVLLRTLLDTMAKHLPTAPNPF